MHKKRKRKKGRQTLFPENWRRPRFIRQQIPAFEDIILLQDPSPKSVFFKIVSSKLLYISQEE
jgi:hypothetical protein